MIELTPDLLRSMPLPNPQKGDKKARGSVLVIAGSVQTPGAALLAGVAALRAGAGRLRIATVRSVATAIAVSAPEAFVLGLNETEAGGVAPSSVDELLPLIESADAVLIGPGLTDQDAIDKLCAALLVRAPPGTSFVFDARALQSLTCLDPLHSNHTKRLILTPHAGEMAGLLGRSRTEIEAQPEQWARTASDRFQAVVALKGARTFIAGPSTDGCVCRRGNVGLATSGSGDVLAGNISGLLARGASPFVATCWGVYLHAAAADFLATTIGPLGFLAREISPEIPRLLGELA
jgi:ADP-dependent NAD(P)H-hydrate dehydratase